MIAPIQRWLKRNKPAVISGRRCGIRPSDISENALRVVERLQKNGFEAFIVGGACARYFAGFSAEGF